MNKENLLFNWWYRNVSKYLTRKEAIEIGREALGEMGQFLNKRDYKVDKIIYLRHRCWALSFPILHKKFDELLSAKQRMNFTEIRPAISDIEQRVKALNNDFEQACA